MRRRRQRHIEEPENHDRWLVSYADFITLLFAFFVVMYAISSVNEGKYRVLSDALDAAFRQATRTAEPMGKGDLARTPDRKTRSPYDESIAIDLPFPTRPRDWEIGTEAAKSIKAPGKPLPPAGFADPDLRDLSDKISTAMGSLLEDELVHVRRDKRWIEIEIQSSVLFSGSNSMLAASAYPVVERIAELLRPYSNTIKVEGYTDDTPIFTEKFRSNWDLSAARAASVVHLLKDNGVDPVRMAAIGYGAEHPVASNQTPAGRTRNRRVVLVVLPGDDPRWERSESEISSVLEERRFASEAEVPDTTRGNANVGSRETATPR